MQQARFRDLWSPLQNENVGVWFKGTEGVWMGEQSIRHTQGPFECRALCDHPGRTMEMALGNGLFVLSWFLLPSVPDFSPAQLWLEAKSFVGH